MDELTKLRNEYKSCIKLADETDSKKEEKYLCKKAEFLLTKLQTECPHNEIVCTQRSYRGSQIDNYEDKHPEIRICLCCGIKEEAYINIYSNASLLMKS